MSQLPAKPRATDERNQRAAPTPTSTPEGQNTTPNEQTHLSIPRKWPTWPASPTTTEHPTATNTDTRSNGSATMQRWMNETGQQSPWNNISGVKAGSEGQIEVNGGMQSGGSAAGTWGSRSE